MSRIVKWLVIIVGGGFIFLFVAASRTPVGELVRNLPFGWISFVKRHAADMTVSWVMVATALAVCAGLLCGGQWLLKSLHRQARQKRDPGGEVRPWPWRWTVGLFVSLWLLFAVTFGATGVFRQTSWLLQYQGNWYGVRRSWVFDLKHLSMIIMMAAEEEEGNIDAVKKAFLAQQPYGRRNPSLEDYSIVLYADAQRKYAGFIIVPRTANLMKYGKFASSATPDLLQPLNELEATVRKLDEKYPVKL